MTRRIELDESGELLRVSFPYHRQLVEVVRSLPQRRFERSTKSWLVPAQHLELVVGRLHTHAFELSEDVEALLTEQGHALDSLVQQVMRAHRPVIDLSALPPGTWTVGKLNGEINDRLRDAFREELWMAAEIQSFDRNRPRGHAFFELIERPFAGSDPNARIRAVMWEPDREHIQALLDEDGGGVRLRDGLIVRALCKVDFYTGQGSVQVSVRDLDLAYTTGTIHQQREAVFRRLQEAGVSEQNTALAWPLCPLRVGLITSYNSDAYMDFTHELRRANLGFVLTVHHAQVQGSNTEASVLRALRWFAARADEFDVLAIVRGGGSRTDLAYFDTDAIGEAVCAHPLKIVVGVGHQRDRSLLDLIAHSEKTPTAAAAALVDRVQAFIRRRDEVFGAIMTHAQRHVTKDRARLERLSARGERAATQRVADHRRKLTRLSVDITTSTHERLHRTQRRFDALAARLPTSVKLRMNDERGRLRYATRRISPERLQRATDRQERAVEALRARLDRATDRAIQRHRDRLTAHQSRKRLLDPANILRRGFALVTGPDGVVRAPADAPPDTAVTIRLASGSLRARVEPPGDPDAR